MTLIAWTEGSPLWRTHIDDLRRHDPRVEVVITTDPDAPEIPNAEMIIGHSIPERVIRRAEKLRLLAIAMAGVDHLPHEILSERGVLVSNAHANGRYVAERVLALVLGYFGKIVPFHEDLAEGKWHGFAAGEPVGDSWRSIIGMRVALLGTGSIGSWTARYMKAFECTTVGFKRSMDTARAPFDEITTDLLTAVRGADVVVCTLPLTPRTEGLLDASVFSAMSGALFVNVGRGTVADEQALYEALDSGVLDGAAIDTWYTYPGETGTTRYPATYPIHTLPNVLLSPHLGGYTAPAAQRGLAEAFDAVRHYLKTGAVPVSVDPSEQY